MSEEGEFQRALEVRLNRPGGPLRVWRQNAGEILVRKGSAKYLFRGGPPGIGDLVGVVRGSGIHIEIECKARHGKDREAQLARAKLVPAWGGVYVKVRGPDVDAAEREIMAAVAGRAAA